MSKKNRPRFHTRSDRRVYDGDTYICTANTPGDVVRIVKALELAMAPPKTLPPSPSSVDGLPEIPPGHTRVTMDYKLPCEIVGKREEDPTDYISDRHFMPFRTISPVLSMVVTESGNGMFPNKVPAKGILRRLVQGKGN